MLQIGCAQLAFTHTNLGVEFAGSRRLPGGFPIEPCADDGSRNAAEDGAGRRSHGAGCDPDRSAHERAGCATLSLVGNVTLCGLIRPAFGTLRLHDDLLLTLDATTPHATVMPMPDEWFCLSHNAARCLDPIREIAGARSLQPKRMALGSGLGGPSTTVELSASTLTSELGPRDASMSRPRSQRLRPMLTTQRQSATLHLRDAHHFFRKITIRRKEEAPMASVDASLSRHTYPNEASLAHHEADPSRHAHEAYGLLHVGFVVAPVVAGLDKFFHLLANWDKYVAPAVGRALPMSVHSFMNVVGIIEIGAGLLVLFRPRVGAYVVAAWLVAIMINLAITGGYLDVALRDLGLCLGALALARLSLEHEKRAKT
jgi:hypothetical protein